MGGWGWVVVVVEILEGGFFDLKEKREKRKRERKEKKTIEVSEGMGNEHGYL